MNYGLSELTIKRIHDVFVRFSKVERAVLYGSRAKGNFKPGSDVDLTLIGKTLTTDDLLTISSELDETLIPYTIDLSLFEKLTDSDLRDHIERIGVVFYQRSDAISL